MAADVGGGDGGGKKKKVKKGRKKKGTPRIDMTPMVDLGFLLLTFFVLTTTMSTPVTMPVMVPAEPDPTAEPPPKVPASKVLNLLIAGKNRIFYYRGIDDKTEMQLNMTSYAPKGLRQVLFEQQKLVKRDFPQDKDENPMIILVKMTDDAKYKNWVDIIDEMNITEQKRYMLMDITKEEVEIVRDYEKSQNLPNSLEKSMEKANVKDV